MEMPTAPQTPIPQENVVREIGFPLFQSKNWIMFLERISILSGVLTALSIVGIIFAWLPIWMGILLFQAANTVDEAQKTGRKEALVASLAKLKLYFTINGILMLIYLIVGAFFLLGTLGLGIFGAIMEGVSD